jgi:uncharacterized lipoprotein
MKFENVKASFCRAALGATIVLLTACASSPQFVTLRPNVDLAGQRIGNGNPVEVTVQDSRANTVIGYRGGVYENSGKISAGNDVAQAVEQAIRARLAAQGFAVNVGSGTQATRLTINIDSLTYNTRTELMKYDVTVEAQLSAQVDIGTGTGTETYSGRYTTKESEVFISSPNTQDNEALINRALSGSVNRVFEDPKIMLMLQSVTGVSGAGSNSNYPRY